MWCPVCGDEFRPGFTRCTDCDTDLVEQRPLPAVPVGRTRGDDHTVLEYDLFDWDDERRDDLTLLLRLQDVPALWEDGIVLTVGRAWQNDVDAAIEHVETEREPIEPPSAGPEPSGATGASGTSGTATRHRPTPDVAAGGPSTSPARLASPGRRLGGYLIDVFVIGIVLQIAELGSAPGLVVGVATVALYEIVAIAIWGRTVGKLMVGTRVVRLDGIEPVGPRVAGIRWGVVAFGTLFVVLGVVGVFLDWLWVAVVYGFVLSASRQGLHDRAARTEVVLTRPTSRGRPH